MCLCGSACIPPIMRERIARARERDGEGEEKEKNAVERGRFRNTADGPCFRDKAPKFGIVR